jgi:hypothetical protein
MKETNILLKKDSEQSEVNPVKGFKVAAFQPGPRIRSGVRDNLDQDFLGNVK